MGIDVDEWYEDAKHRMQQAVSVLHDELSKLRSGRAHPSLLDQVKINYYGTETPLKQLANVTIDDARTLVVTPWDKGAVSAIEKGIMLADLGLNPVTAGQVIRVPLPPLTEERRRGLVKVVKQEGEGARVAVRNVRRDINQHIKESLKEKIINEDDAKRAESNIQELTNRMVSEIDQLVANKEKELMIV